MLLLWTIVACAPPPEAPEDLDSVAAYLFEHHLDDPAVVAAGLENLRAWFESDFDPEQDRGFELVVALSEDAVGAIDASASWVHPESKDSRAFVDMAGAAAGTVGPQSVEDYVAALVDVEQDIVFPDTFVEWGRTWRLCDGTTFADGDCEFLESDEQQSAAFGLGMRTEGEAYNQYRWITLEDGQVAMNHRNWQLYPPEVSSNLLEVVDQYYLNTFVPSSDGSQVFRFQATWAVFGDSVPRDLGLRLTANSMFDSSQELDAWLEDNDP